MPNGWEPPDHVILPSLRELKSIRFAFMFSVGPDGKCHLKYDDADWRSLIACHRSDWKARLGRVLEEEGSPRDMQSSKEHFGL